MDFGKSGLFREVIRISWPMILSELGDSLFSITDTYFVSRLGTAALGAVGVGSYLSWLFFVIVAFFSIGTLVYVSQCYGAGEMGKAKAALGETIVFSLLVSVAAALIVHKYAGNVVSIIAGPNVGVVSLGAKYFSIRILGLPLLAVAVIMDSSLRAVGATKYSMIAMLSSVALNIILDPIFIFGFFGFPRMGVAGAAIATVASIAYLVPAELFFLRKVGLIPAVKPTVKYVGKVVRIGAPAALERFVFSIGQNAYIAFIARCGEIALAAHQIGVRIESFIYMPGFAFSIASATLVGQRVGANNMVEAKKIGWEAAKVALAFMAVLGVFAALTSSYLVAPFAPTLEVAYLASIYLILAGLSEPGLALGMTLGGGIRGGGNTLIPLIINATSLYLFRVLPASFLTGIFGVVGAWIAMFVDVYMRGAIFFIVYKKYFARVVRRVV